jgi:protein tyrosine/serine phosphatase
MSEHRTVNALSLTCHLERSEGSHTGCAKHANVRRVIDYRAGDPSPSEPALSERNESNGRLGITA